MITYTTAHTPGDLEGILTLQKANLARNLDAEEVQSQGFVTVVHSYDLLNQLNALENHIIAKADGKVIGYLLAMTERSKAEIPILMPMFDMFAETTYDGKPIPAYNYLVVGQACIDRSYRGLGVFDRCYDAYKKHHGHKYDFAVTEIASTNQRSLNAHKRIGFKEISTYPGPDKTHWHVVLWDWRSTT
jgi:hypothetical protein